MSKLKTERAWICECGKLEPRKKGDKAIICPACGSTMKKGRRPVDEIKEGKIDRSEKEELATATKKKSRKEDDLIPQGTKSETLLNNFRLFLAQASLAKDVKTWWTFVFPDAKYPPPTISRILVELKIEYELSKRILEEKEVDISVKFQKNYDAAMSMIPSKFSPHLQKIIHSYSVAEKLKEEKDDKKLKGLKESREDFNIPLKRVNV